MRTMLGGLNLWKHVDAALVSPTEVMTMHIAQTFWFDGWCRVKKVVNVYCSEVFECFSLKNLKKFKKIKLVDF